MAMEEQTIDSRTSRQNRLRPRLAVVFVAAVGGPALLIVLLLAWVSYRQTASVARELTNARLGDFHLRIGERLRSQLEVPKFLANLNLSQIRELPGTDPSPWRETFFRQLEAFPSISAIAWGDEDGRALWIGRRAGEKRLVMGLKPTPDERLTEFELLADGEPGIRLGDMAYQPQRRPWYEAAASAKRALWTSPWVWSSADSTRAPTLAIAYSTPLIDEAGNLRGVIDAEIALDELSAFLRDLVEKSRVTCFVVDHRGYVLAQSSQNAAPISGDQPLLAIDSPDPLIKGAAALLASRIGERRSSTSLAETDLSAVGAGIVEGQLDHFKVLKSDLSDDSGLTLSIYTAIDERLIVHGAEVAARNTFVYGLLAVAAAIAVGVACGTTLVRPVHAVVRHVRKVARGDFRSRLRLSGITELSELASELNLMSVALEDRMELRQSLSLAKDVQQALLPSTPPAIPGLEIYGYSNYCDDTGGDCYDYFDLGSSDPNRLHVAVGDVSGHGIAAAMLMASARAMLRSHAGQARSLADLLAHVNRHLCHDVSNGRFMTLLLASVDASRGHLRWASAGHDAPIIYDPSTDDFVTIEAAGLPLGIDPEAPYLEGTYEHLAPRCVILLGTDGIWETRCARQREMFDRDRLRDHLRRSAHLSAEQIGISLTATLDAFRGNNRPRDDVTFVVIKVLSS